MVQPVSLRLEARRRHRHARKRRDMRQLNRILNFIDRVSEKAGALTRWLLIPIVLIVANEVFLRYVVNKPQAWSYELSEYILGAFCLLAGAWVLRFDRHVRFDLFRLKWNPRLRSVIDTFTTMFILYFVGVLFWKGTVFSIITFQEWRTSGSMWNPPLFPYRVVLPIACLLLLFQALAKFIRDLHTAITGRTELWTNR